jgi:predicted MPP superfamily phosphohydrolase
VKFNRRWLVLAVLALLALWVLVVEPRRLTVHRETLTIPAWGKRPPLKIAMAGDLHVGSPWWGPDQLRRVVRALNDADADVIVLLGDYVIQDVVGGTPASPEQIAAELRPLHAQSGVYAVIGNHDNWLDGARVAAALRTAGITVLEDDVVRVPTVHGAFTLAGVSDLWTAPHDVNGTLAKVTTEDPVVLITHNPDLFPTVPARVALTLAAHTHGGQCNFPLIGRPIVPSHYRQRYAAGHVVEGGRHLFVTTGVGTSIIPVRFRVVPEIVVLEVR